MWLGRPPNSFPTLERRAAQVQVGIMCGDFRGHRWALLLTLALAGAPGSAGAQGLSFGPLTTEEGGPLQRLAYTPTTEAAHLIGSGRLQAGLWMGYSNIFEQDSAASHELYLDPVSYTHLRAHET